MTKNSVLITPDEYAKLDTSLVAGLDCETVGDNLLTIGILVTVVLKNDGCASDVTTR